MFIKYFTIVHFYFAIKQVYLAIVTNVSIFYKCILHARVKIERDSFDFTYSTIAFTNSIPHYYWLYNWLRCYLQNDNQSFLIESLNCFLFTKIKIKTILALLREIIFYLCIVTSNSQGVERANHCSSPFYKKEIQHRHSTNASDKYFSAKIRKTLILVTWKMFGRLVKRKTISRFAI